MNDTQTWRADLYARLSREDRRRTVPLYAANESDSIKNQRELLLDFVSKNPDINVAHFLADDGETGANFERDEFKMMIRHIEEGMVNCVIVKDAYVKLRINFFGLNFVNILRAILEKEKSTVHCWGIVLFSCN